MTGLLPSVVVQIAVRVYVSAVWFVKNSGLNQSRNLMPVLGEVPMFTCRFSA